MNACLPALAKLKGKILSAFTDTKATTVLWEAACGWEEAVNKLEPTQEQDQLLRAAAEVASLLAPTMAKAARLGAPGAGEAPPAGKACDSSSVAQRTRASIAASVAKAADGLTQLLLRQSAAADPALLQSLADGITAAVLCHNMPAPLGQYPRHLEAVMCLATTLLEGAMCAANSSPPAHRALAQAVSRPGLVVGLLHGTVESLGAVAGGKSSPSQQNSQCYATRITLSLIEKLLASELGRLAADEQLVQQLLRLVVLPNFADLLNNRTRMPDKPLLDSTLAGILRFLRTDPIRPHARSLLARVAPPLGSAAWTQDIPAAVAAAAAAPAEAQGSATLGGNLVLMLMEVLAEQRASWHRGRKAAERKSEHSAAHRQLEAQAAAVANLGCLLPQLLQYLPCALDIEQAHALHDDYDHRLSSSRASGTSIGGLCRASTMMTVQHAAPEWAGRAAEAVFLKGVVALAAALLDLKDSGAVHQLVYNTDDLPPPESSDEDVARDAAVAVWCLCGSLAAFQCWAEGTLDPAAVRGPHEFGFADAAGATGDVL
ncbi:hypothetical protein N2152v2_005403 [Parachlorella kessleri]